MEDMIFEEDYAIIEEFKKINKNFFSIKETAQLLGRSYITIYRWIRDYKLGATKPGKSYLIPSCEIEKFLQRRNTLNIFDL